MYFNRLEIQQFRNFQGLRVEFAPQLNVLVGANGQGKTNLIESLFLLAHSVSFRPSSNASLRNTSASSSHPCRIEAKAFKNNLQYELRLQIGEKRKEWSVNGKPASSLALERHFPMVLFSPESLAVIKEGPDQRRQFLDEMLASLDPANGKIMGDYQTVLSSRNRVLREQLKGRLSQKEALLILDSLESNFLETATRLTVARLKAVAALQNDFEEAYRFISAQNVDISVDYLISEVKVRDWGYQEVHAALSKRLSELHFQELASGVSLVGPQKHDIRVLVDGNDSRFYCSQGQQRALILSFKMARIVYHYRVHNFYPFLLLDDVLSELDFEKRKNLVVFLRNIRSQIFITTTDFTLPRDFISNGCHVLEVTSGLICPRDESAIPLQS